MFDILWTAVSLLSKLTQAHLNPMSFRDIMIKNTMSVRIIRMYTTCQYTFVDIIDNYNKYKFDNYWIYVHLIFYIFFPKGHLK